MSQSGKIVIPSRPHRDMLRLSHHTLMAFSRIFICVLSISLLCLYGCSSEVGDPCISDAQCGLGRTCDLSSFEGYCTVKSCEADSCPSGSICVTFEDQSTYCMAICQESEDCRDGYQCDMSFAAAPFCRQKPQLTIQHLDSSSFILIYPINNQSE